MNKYILRGIALLAFISIIVLPVSAEMISEGNVNFHKSEQFNYGYNVLQTYNETIWTVWNSENYCKIVYEDEANQKDLQRFQEAVNTALSAEGLYNVEVQKASTWWNIETMLRGLLGKKYKGETLEMRIDNVDYHFHHIQ